MKRNIGLTDNQIKLILDCLMVFIQIQKLLNPKKFSSENEIHKISEYTDLYEVIAEQYYDENKFYKKIS